VRVRSAGCGGCQDCFGRHASGYHPRIADSSEKSKLDALVKLEVACQLALESLPKLPSETGERLREPIQTLCDVTRTELGRLQAGYP
jgi:hypothetical protein